MTILVLSDSHGRADLIRQILRLHLTCSRIDRVFFLGDGVRDFLRVMEEFPAVPYNAVRGNCDICTLSPAERDNIPTVDIAEVSGVRFMLMHGHSHDVKSTYEHAADYAIASHAEILLFGHTHRQEDIRIDGSLGGRVRMINPGALSSKFEPSYALLNIHAGQVLCGFGTP